MDDATPNTGNREAAAAVNRHASVWMKRGIALLNENTPASLKEAIGNFDRAIELRTGLPLEADPFFRYGLAAGWMNRGDALTRLGLAKNLTEAVHSYDAALEALRELPLEANPLFRLRVAIAWQNRGLTLQAQKHDAAIIEAARSFKAAIATLQNGNAAEIADRDFLLAAAKLNYANLLAGGRGTESAARARVMAKEILSGLASKETHDVALAEVELKARHVLCRAIAVLLSENEATGFSQAELLAEATDAVEGGLTLAAAWKQADSEQLRPLAQELFRFGARAYQMFQPHFLNEFLLENLDPSQSAGAFASDSTMHAAALESLWRTFREIQREGFKTLNTPQFEGLLKQLRELRVVEDRLTELRGKYLKG